MVTLKTSINSKRWDSGGTVNDQSMSRNATDQLQHVPIGPILDSISDGIFIVNKELLITSFNRAAEEITGIPRIKAIGQRCFTIFRSNLCGKHCVLQKALSEDGPIRNRCASIINFAGQHIPVNVSTTLLRNRANEVIGAVEVFQELRLDAQPPEEPDGQVRLDNLITRNQTMGEIITVLPRIAASDNHVLIEGENGTGKEMLARALHAYSPRCTKPFIALTCKGLPEILPDGERRGGLSGAGAGMYKDMPCLAALPCGSTVFLDEISLMSGPNQRRLLRLFQAKKHGSQSRTCSLEDDVRVIASTRRDISSLAKKGVFSRDLYLQINSVTLELPPIRKRKEDIPLLIEHFISCFNQRQHKAVKGVSQETMALLMAYNFPGNITELQDIIEHAFDICAEGFISPSHLPDEVRKNSIDGFETLGMESAVQAVEAQAIIEALKRNNYNRMAAARDLGIHKSTFFRKIKHLGLVLPQIDGRFRSISGKNQTISAV
ncbi:MAG TPA: Fis family transcriptional regulator [Desulfobacteraceae bacterium]|nr:Fis family transcriptional regulator [Desulfobacteraceae bacterium]